MPKYIEFALLFSRFYFSMLDCYFSLFFLHNVSQIVRLYAIPFIRFPSCCSGFIQDFLDHYVFIDVGSLMYMSRAYDVSLLSEFLSNRLQTLAL